VESLVAAAMDSTASEKSELRPSILDSLGILANSYIPQLSPRAPSSIENIWHKLSRILVVVAFGDLIAAVYYFWNSVYLGKPYPYNSFLSVPWDRFTDYDNMILMCRNLNPYQDFSRSGYPPFANLFYYCFSPFPIRIGYIVFLIPPVAFISWITFRELKGLPITKTLFVLFFISIFSYPFLYAFDRGNLELYLLIAVGTFLLFYESNDPILKNLSCIALAAAIGLKIYPAVFLLILFKDRRFREIVTVLLLCEVLTVGSACAFVGGAQNALLDLTEIIGETGRLLHDRLSFAHGNSGIFYGTVIVLKVFNLNSALEWFYQNYRLIASLLFIFYSAAILRARINLWESAVCVTCLFCLIPSLSNDYRTLQFTVPLLLFVTSATARNIRTSIASIVFGLLLVPRNYWILLPDVGPGDVGIGSVITPCLLLLLLNVVLFMSSPRMNLAWDSRQRV